MSKGEVVQHIGDGLYEIKLKFAVDRIQAELVRVNERIAELAVVIPNQKTVVLQAEQAVRDVAAEIDALIPLYRDDPAQYGPQIKELQQELIRKQQTVSSERYERDKLIAENLELLKRRGQIERIPEEELRQVWCADYTEDLAGEIGVVDINDEGGKGLVIQPGFNGDASYQPSRDGILMPRGAQSGAQVYFNAAILPGVQKWLPRYRVGTISNIVNDTCIVALDEAESSAQGLEVNLFDIYSNVPIQYMDCNGDVFEDGDKVLVRFFDSGPQVVGFANNPKPCLFSGFHFLPAKASGQGIDPVLYGEPFYDASGVAINPPLGTEGGSNPAWIAGPRNDVDPYRITKGRIDNAGNMNWIGPDNLILSWEGPGSRIWEWEYARNSGTSVGWRESWRLDTKVYYRNRVLANMAAHGTNTEDYVIGAAIYDGSLLVVTVSDVVMSPTFALYQLGLSDSMQLDGTVSKTATYTPPESDIQFRSGFYFAESGSGGVCTLRTDNYAKLFALRVSPAGGFVRTELYDANDGGSPQTYRDVQCTYTINRTTDGFIDTVTWDETVVTYEPASDVPIYLDYRGESEITVFHSIPSTVTTSEASGTNDNPYKAVDSSRVITPVYSGKEKITTSEGDTLAEIDVTRSGSYSLDVSPVDGQGGNESVTLSRSAIGRRGLNSVPSFNVCCINARDRICALGYLIDESAGSGTNPDAQVIYNSTQTEAYYLISDWDGSSTVTNRLDVFADGAKVFSSDISAETTPVTSQRVYSDRWYYPSYLDDKTGSGIYTSVDYYGKPYVLGDETYFYPELNEFCGVKHSGKIAVSVLHQDENGIARYQYLEGEGDPAETIFGQNPDAPYVMHQLTVI